MSYQQSYQDPYQHIISKSNYCSRCYYTPVSGSPNISALPCELKRYEEQKRAQDADGENPHNLKDEVSCKDTEAYQYCAEHDHRGPSFCSEAVPRGNSTCTVTHSYSTEKRCDETH